jgi:tetratricopeptide (TPR) repeat protein
MNAASALDEFMNKTNINPAIENETLLLTAYQLVKEEVVKSNYSIKSVRLAHKIYGYLGDKGLNERVDLMKKYLLHKGSSSPEDLFWVNWELVDNLALLKRYKEMIKEQRIFLSWAKSNMSPEFWLKVMYDSTQAIGWVHENRTNEWFDIYYDLINSIEPTKQNRHHRVLYVETAAGLFAFDLKKYDDALIEVERYKSILLEDTSWCEFKKFSIRRISYLLEVYNGKNEMEKYDAVANDAISIIESYISEYNQGLTIDFDEVSDMAHEIGTCLMWKKRYQKAMSLFEYAIKYQGTGISHFFYAICIWAIQKNRQKTLHHLQMAELKVKGNGGLRSRYIHMFLEQAEFADARDDNEFLLIFKR